MAKLANRPKVAGRGRKSVYAPMIADGIKLALENRGQDVNVDDDIAKGLTQGSKNPTDDLAAALKRKDAPKLESVAQGVKSAAKRSGVTASVIGGSFFLVAPVADDSEDSES